MNRDDVRNMLNKAKWSKAETSKIHDLLRDAEDAYFNTGSPIMSDDDYDALRERLPDVHNKVGYVPRSNKVKLPHWMGSLDKLKESSKISLWISKHDRLQADGVVVTDKLDGVSALLTYVDGNLRAAHTRGDGSYGQDITRHLLSGCYARAKEPITATIRGELIIPRAIQERSRNIVSGLVNSDDTSNHPMVNSVRFVAYELVEPVGMKPLDQIKWLQRNLFSTAYHKHFQWRDLSVETLTNWLNERKQLSLYDIDGIVVSHNAYHTPVPSKNAEHAFAFKSALFFEAKPTTVTRVLWNVSKDGYLKPTLECRPVSFNNGAVTVSHCTGFNGKFVVDNVLGPGSKVTVVLSGDVIPHISNVVSQSSEGKPSLPSDYDPDMYEWSPGGVDLRIITSKQDACVEVVRARFVHMLTKLGIDGLKSGTITRLFDDGNVRTLKQLFAMGANNVKGMNGFGEVSATKLVSAIQHKREHMDCLELAVASNLFGRGFGERKLKPIFAKYPPMTTTPSVVEVAGMRGMSEESAKAYLRGLSLFRSFVRDNEVAFSTATAMEHHLDTLLEGHVIVYTQFRDDDLKRRIEQHGGTVTNSVSKNTTHLLVVSDDYSRENTKVKGAYKCGVAILTKDTYIQKYLT